MPETVVGRIPESEMREKRQLHRRDAENAENEEPQTHAESSYLQDTQAENRGLSLLVDCPQIFRWCLGGERLFHHLRNLRNLRLSPPPTLIR